MVLRRKKIRGEVEGSRWPFRLETDAVLLGDIGKTAGYVRPAIKDYTFHFRSDRRQRGADIVAAIEKSGKPGVGNSVARRRDKRPEPARTGISTGIRRAKKQHCLAGPRRGGQRGGCLGECVDNDGGDSGGVSLLLLQLGHPFIQCPQAIDNPRILATCCHLLEHPDQRLLMAQHNRGQHVDVVAHQRDFIQDPALLGGEKIRG